MTGDKKKPKHEQLTDLQEAAYKSRLPGLVLSIKCLMEELNSIREKLGIDPVPIEGLDAEWSGTPKKGGITNEGRQKLREMMKQRWQQAYKEGVHVTKLKPRRKGTSETGNKSTNQ